MKINFAIAAVLLTLAAAPVMAAEEYQAGVAHALDDRVATADTGSVQAPAFDGQHALATPREQIVAQSASEAPVESLNSETPAQLAQQ